ncbi:MAG: histidine phosphatase family protein [Pseudomonadota bacterium]
MSETASPAPGPQSEPATPASADGNPPRGPIIISRHGRPALNRKAGPRLTWREYSNWWDRYEIGSLDANQAPPARLMEAVADADIVLASQRPRAIETAALAAPHLTTRHDPVFNEAPLPPPCIPGVRLLPKTWNILARAAWMNGHSLQGESIIEARLRAAKAATVLHDAASDGKVYLAAHGWFNRMLRPELRALGWRCTRDGGDGYWSFRVYEYRAG